MCSNKKAIFIALHLCFSHQPNKFNLLRSFFIEIAAGTKQLLWNKVFCVLFKLKTLWLNSRERSTYITVCIFSLNYTLVFLCPFQYFFGNGVLWTRSFEFTWQHAHSVFRSPSQMHLSAAARRPEIHSPELHHSPRSESLKLAYDWQRNFKDCWFWSCAWVRDSKAKYDSNRGHSVVQGTRVAVWFGKIRFCNRYVGNRMHYCRASGTQSTVSRQKRNCDDQYYREATWFTQWNDLAWLYEIDKPQTNCPAKPTLQQFENDVPVVIRCRHELTQQSTNVWPFQACFGPWLFATLILQGSSIAM